MMETDNMSIPMNQNMDNGYQDPELMDDGYNKRDGMDVVLWTLKKALTKKMQFTDPKDDDDEYTTTAEPNQSELNTAGYSMDSILACLPDEKTELENAIESQIGLPVMPFDNMDRSGRSVCTLFLKGLCPHGTKCHLRHLKGEKTVVCKHWLRGLCKKGDDCEFLHEYDLTKMPECFFFSRYNACSNKECPFRHIDPESKIKDCPWYDRGFCRHGPYCKYRHRRRIMCDAYLVGFCPLGPDCPHFHPPNLMPPPEVTTIPGAKFSMALLCHNCHERGHKANTCPHLPKTAISAPTTAPPTTAPAATPTTTPAASIPNGTTLQPKIPGQFEPRKSLSDVVCFKCGAKGHYANRCINSGVMSFLRSNPVSSGGNENKNFE